MLRKVWFNELKYFKGLYRHFNTGWNNIVTLVLHQPIKEQYKYQCHDTVTEYYYNGILLIGKQQNKYKCNVKQPVGPGKCVKYSRFNELERNVCIILVVWNGSLKLKHFVIISIGMETCLLTFD